MYSNRSGGLVTASLQEHGSWARMQPGWQYLPITQRAVFDPYNYIRLGVKAHVCNPRLRRWRQEDVKFIGHLQLHRASKPSLGLIRFCLKINK